MNDTPDIRARIKSAAITLILAALLWCLLFFARFSIVAPLTEEGLIIYFGVERQEEVTSSSEIAASEKSAPETQPSTPKKTSTSETTQTITSEKKDVITQDLREAIVLKKNKKNIPQKVADSKKDKNKTKAREVHTSEKPDQRVFGALERILKGKSDKAGQKNGSGAGQSDDNKHSTANTGKEGSSNNNYRLNGRKALQKPRPDYPCDQEGVVVVRVVVDRTGKVIEATPGIKGTTNAADCLKNPAKEAALKTIWEAAPQAPARQIGKIIYRFRIK